jgi:hypothetical protein
VIASGTPVRSGGHTHHLDVPGAAISGAFDFFRSLLDREATETRCVLHQEREGYDAQQVGVSGGGETSNSGEERCNEADDSDKENVPTQVELNGNGAQNRGAGGRRGSTPAGTAQTPR